MSKFNYLYIVGVFTLLLSAFGLFGLNFNPGKGDTLKTHYYSFALAITFAVLVINHVVKRKITTKILITLISFTLFLFLIGLYLTSISALNIYV